MNPLRRSQIEIEKRFAIHPLIKKHLNTHGAKLMKTVQFRDTYFDTSDCSLTSNNQWLRLRDNRWQLKQPITGFIANVNNMRDCESSNDENTTAIYEEFENIEEIAKQILHAFPSELKSDANFQMFDDYSFSKTKEMESETNMNNIAFKEWLQEMLKVEILAEFETNRESYEMVQNGRRFEIELDFTDFSYNVMEIETIVELDAISNMDEYQRRAIAEATKKLNDFCSYFLDCEELQLSFTKIQIFLWLFNHSAYEKICNAHMFPMIDECMKHQILSSIEKNKNCADFEFKRSRL